MPRVIRGQMDPRHIGIIMDGNGRWAQLREQPRIEGHREGAVSVREVVRACRERGLKALTLYAFSQQNWARPIDEVNGLMELLVEYLKSEREELLEQGIHLTAIGQIHLLPKWVQDPLLSLEKETSVGNDMTLCIALSYGGREAIVEATREALRQGMAPSELTEDKFSSLLPTRDLPPLDLLIRTSGELRLSNFLLWESAYSEFYFTEVLWPDFRRKELGEALDAYAHRQRRFGLTGAQLASSTPAEPAE